MTEPGRPASSDQGSTAALTAGLVVAGVSAGAVVGPLLGVSPWLIAGAAGGGLAALTLDAAQFGGLGGHLLAEALPFGFGRSRLRRIAIHEAGHLLLAADNALPLKRVLVGSRACLRHGLRVNGSTELEPPPRVKMPLEDLRRWSRVLLAGMAAECLVYGGSRGGADDRALLGRLWGLSGHDVMTAQNEQRRARREVDQWLTRHRDRLEASAEELLQEL
ncbi:MAG: hypothetical protein ACO215_06035 [Vulcanococcus sp.]